MWTTLANIFKRTWQHIESQVLDSIPNLLAALVIICTGVLLARLIGAAARRLLQASEWDHRADRLGLGAFLESVGILSAAGFLAWLLEWVIILVTCGMALRILHPGLAAELERRFFLYLPQLLAGVAVLLLGFFLSRLLSRSALIAAVNAGIREARLLSHLVRIAIMLVASVMAVEQVGIGRTTMLTAFAILFGGATLAATLALGLGTHDLVRRWMDAKQEDKPETIHHW